MQIPVSMEGNKHEIRNAQSGASSVNDAQRMMKKAREREARDVRREKSEEWAEMEYSRHFVGLMWLIVGECRCRYKKKVG